MRLCGQLLAAALCVFATLAPIAAFAQPGAPFTSPEVSADGRLTLRYLAPNAKSVTADGELDGKAHALTRGDNGVWSVTIGPLAPDIYTYAFNVDGVTALDPLNANTKYGYGRFGAVSIVQVPGDGPQFYDVKPVPHGEVRIRPYFSKTLGVSRTAWIYTPPGYDTGGNFPVLYLLHGAGDIESGWTMIGRANNIIDNAIAEGKAKPMVVVMPLGHAMQSYWTGPARLVPDPVSKAMAVATLAEIINSMMGGDGNGGLSPVTKDIVIDVMPMVESTYKVSKRPEDRAIAGLSMGGGHTINIAFVRPELFRYVALMSPAAGGGVAKLYPRIAEKPDILNQQFKLFWVGVGKDDALTGPGDKAFSEALHALGVKHEFVLTEGRHEWTVWRHYLNDLAPKLFR
jgi:enterochelin esterase family protein